MDQKSIPKREASVLNVSRLNAAMDNALAGPGFAQAEVIARGRRGERGMTYPAPQPKPEQSQAW